MGEREEFSVVRWGVKVLVWGTVWGVVLFAVYLGVAVLSAG